jgi:hypothetical protein
MGWKVLEGLPQVPSLRSGSQLVGNDWRRVGHPNVSLAPINRRPSAAAYCSRKAFLHCQKPDVAGIPWMPPHIESKC